VAEAGYICLEAFGEFLVGVVMHVAICPLAIALVESFLFVAQVAGIQGGLKKVCELDAIEIIKCELSGGVFVTYGSGQGNDGQNN
jgi:hypothetical protein